MRTVKLNPEDVRESFKLAFEGVKHLTTLSAGSFVLIATFLKDIFPKGQDNTLALPLGDKVLVSASFLFFALSLVFSAFSLWNLATIVRSRREFHEKKGAVR
jgi:hypothetical protein